MKILHFSQGFYPVTGGIEKNIEDICKGMQGLGHQSSVCCLRPEGTAKDEVWNGISIHRMRSLNLRFYKIAPCVLRLVKRHDVIHVHGLGSFSDTLAMAKALRLHSKPLVLSTHGGIFHTKRLSRMKKLYFNAWCRLALKFFSKVIAVSGSDRELFSGISRSVIMIPDSIDYGSLSSISRKPQKDVFICVGRLSQNKRIDNLIRAFSVISKHRPDARLFIIGGDWQGARKGLEALANGMGMKGKVIFTGRLGDREMMGYLARASFFLTASEYEGFGISVLEAMAAGLPVIVNNIPSFRTFVKHGKNGFIIDYSEPEKAARAILDIMERNGMKAISGNAMKTAKGYDYKAIAKRLEDVYLDALRTS